LLAIRKVQPTRLLLRELPETKYSALKSLHRDILPLAASLLLLSSVGLLASWLADSLLRGFAFLAGLAAVILVLALGARFIMLLIKHLPRPSSLSLRHGLKNLNRPGSHLTSVLVALGLGAAFVLTIYFIQTSLLTQIIKGAPADFPNVFLIGITEQEKATLQKICPEPPALL